MVRDACELKKWVHGLNHESELILRCGVDNRAPAARTLS